MGNKAENQTREMISLLMVEKVANGYIIQVSSSQEHRVTYIASNEAELKKTLGELLGNSVLTGLSIRTKTNLFTVKMTAECPD